jgi:hypothetical protein
LPVGKPRSSNPSMIAGLIPVPQASGSIHELAGVQRLEL